MPKQFEIKSKSESEAELLIFGDIGDSWWGESVIAKDVAEELQALDVEKLVVRINSYGGSVSDGIAIYNAIKRHKAKTEIHIDGVAVSIASLIAMAGDEIIMAENSLLMIHAPWGSTYGNAKELREYADVLDTYAKAMASSYTSKTGKTNDEILDLLTDGVDHWYTASEALAEGFVDIVNEEIAAAAHGFDKSKFAISGMETYAKKLQPVTSEMKSPKLEPAAHVAAKIEATEEEAVMPKLEDKKADTPVDAKTEADIQAAVKANEKQRRSDIRSAFDAFGSRNGVLDVMNACLDDMEISAADARDKLLAHLGKNSAPAAANPRIESGADATDKFREGAQASLLIRANLKENDGANEFRSFSLFELARHSLALAGVNTSHMDKLEVVAAAFTHTTSDFTNLLANTANKAMMKGYDEAEETFQLWTNTGELGDFKATSRVDLNSFPSLDNVRDGAEYKYATVGDRGENIQLATYGKLFSITRQTIINDDLQAFTRIPMKMGRAAIRTVGDLAYAVLTSNPAMSDGTALFHADHGNLLSALGPHTSSIDKMRVAMGKQKDGGDNATALNIRLANLLVPMALEGVAKVARDSEFEVGASTKNNTTPNSVRGTFEVISDARLDEASATAWYGAANGSVHDTVEVAYLDGNQSPTLEQQAGWNVDGTEFKVRIDAGVSPIDFRGMAKNPGA